MIMCCEIERLHATFIVSTEPAEIALRSFPTPYQLKNILLVSVEREVIFHNAHVLVIIEVYFFIDLIENAGLARSIRKSLEESLLLFMEGERVRIG